MKTFVHPATKDITLHGILHALGDPARLHIVKNIYAAKDCLNCVQSIVGIEHLPVATRSHCFRMLREAGLIRSEKKGRDCYNTLRLAEIEKKFPKLLATILKNT